MKWLLLLAALPALAQDGIITLEQWRVHDGDNPAWTRPEFDDSGWKGAGAPQPSNEPGWSWYRTTFSLSPGDIGRQLAISFGPLEEVYEVFVEGVSVGRFGHWEPEPESPVDRHQVFQIPGSLPAGVPIHVALRRWIGGSRVSFLHQNSIGQRYVRHAPRVGSADTLKAWEQSDTYAGVFRKLPDYAAQLMAMFAAVFCLLMYSAARRKLEYLFLALYCASWAAPQLLAIPFAFSAHVMRRSPLLGVLMAIFWNFESFGILVVARISPRYQRFLYFAAAVSFLGAAGGGVSMSSQAQWLQVPYRWEAWYLPVVFFVALCGLVGERRPSSWAIAGSLMLTALAASTGQFRGSAVISVGEFPLDTRTLVQLILVLVTVAVFYQRFREDQRRQALLDEEFAGARRVQQRMLASAEGVAVGFTVDAVYRPAREVGGDFYQAIPGEDGSLLLVVGDVSGKGLDAAMLVAAVVGSIRTQLSRRPAEVLAAVNRSLIGQTNGGFVTCCCALFGTDGSVCLANAGNPAPYEEGREIALDDALPLGIFAGAEYTETVISSPSLTFVSDGVVEAATASGELFGFERTREISGRPAGEIAAAAQAWGQNDDITVVTVRRVA